MQSSFLAAFVLLASSQAAPMPVEQQPPTPVEQHSPTPVEQPPTPVEQHSPTPVEQHSRSLTDRYWKKGQCRFSGTSSPQWRKKSSNRWHDCPANTVCDDGRRGCQCATGFAATANEDSAYPTCTACAANSVSAVGDAVCTVCAAGYAPDETQGACKPCHAGSFSAGGAGSCTACPAWTASDEGAATCTEYPVTELEFQSQSKCFSNREVFSGTEGQVAMVTAGLDNGEAVGAEECEEACSRALAAGTDHEAGCCFLNTFNGVCKFFDGTFEASSVVMREGYARQYFAAPMKKLFGQTPACTGSAAELEAANEMTCAGDDEPATVATLELDDSGGKDTSKDAACYDACVLHAQVEGDSGGGCCRMNHFNGNCNWYAGGRSSGSTTHMMHAIDMTCG